ncbi:MAG: hypothetical protein LBS51_06715 [Oscillospiraceae bacterium]|jgi:hypothetical protein|nr:hypothetical protein [Oscillospiraceae bacterium]
MKKLLAIILVLCVTFALFSCGKSDDKTSPSGDATTSGGANNSPTASGGGDRPSESAPDQPAEGGTSVRDTLNVAMTQDRGTLDPSYMNGL